jgi:hypothetical protein
MLKLKFCRNCTLNIKGKETLEKTPSILASITKGILVQFNEMWAWREE